MQIHLHNKPLIARCAASFTLVLLISLVVCSTLKAENWISAGPGPVINAGDEGVASPQGLNPICGSINSFAPHPTDANVLYAAGSNGGVWKTINAKANSPNWTPLSDTGLPSLSISAMAINPLNPNVVFAGSGRVSSLAKIGGALFGVARSTDGGATWVITGANVVGDVRAIVPMATGGTINQPVFAISTGGLYRSLDGGGSFTKLFDATIGNTVLSDLIADPTTANRLFAAGNGKVFRTDDAGATWKDVSSGTGFVVTANARVLLGLHASAAGNAVYAAIISIPSDGRSGVLITVFRSADQGATWTDLKVPPILVFPGKQGNLHGAFLADKTDPKTVWISGDRQPDRTEDGTPNPDPKVLFPNLLGANNYSGNIWRNVSGTWESVAANGANGTSPHADSRAMLFDADGNILHSCDGGIFKLNAPNGTTPADKTGTRRWSSLNGDLRTLESHNAAYDPVSRIFVCGAQDNGANLGIVPANPVWLQYLSGDGGRVDVDFDQTTHPGISIRYGSAQNFGNFSRRSFDANNVPLDNLTFCKLMIDAGDGAGQILTDFDKVLFLQPFVLNQVDPKRMLIGTEFIYESMDRGDTLTNLGLAGVPSARLLRAMGAARLAKTNAQDNAHVERDGDDTPFGPEDGAIGDGSNSGSAAMAYGGRFQGNTFPDVFYVGAGNTISHRVILGGPITVLNAYPGGLVRVLVMDPGNYKRVFVLDTTGKVFMTSDEGASWTAITSNLGSLTTDVRTIEIFDPDQTFQNAVLFAGGLGGVWKMANPAPSSTWVADSNALPPKVLVYDLRFDYTATILTAATLGRGVYFIGEVPPATATSPKQLNISTRLRVLEGERALIAGFIVTGSDPKKVLIRGLGPSVPVTGQLADPTLEVFNGATSIAKNDNWKDTQQAAIEATTIPPSNPLESAIVVTLNPGSYTAILRGANNGTGIGLVEVYDLAQTANSKLANISTRGFVDTGNNVMIGGIIVGGGSPNTFSRVLVRAIGPSLAKSGVTGALQDPTLELRDANAQLLAQNDNWKDTQITDIQNTTIPPTDDRESALIKTLTPGNYTAIVRGTNNTTGVAVVEAYNLQ
jgi:hypothetical protein